jgi:putative hydrolase of the HAD superfamily
MGIRAVLFDVGSVLVRETDRGPRKAAAARLGLDYDQLVEAVLGSPWSKAAACGELDSQGAWEKIGRGLSLDRNETDHLKAAFFAGDSLDLTLVSWVRRLRKDYQVGILSNAWDDLRARLEQDWKIAHLFDPIIISAELGVMKPEPAIYRAALESFRRKPSEVVFIDDQWDNIQAAVSLGMKGIHFRHNRGAMTVFNQLARAEKRKKDVESEN